MLFFGDDEGREVATPHSAALVGRRSQGQKRPDFSKKTGGSITSADADSALRPDRLERLEDFLVASTFLFCDWIEFVS